LAGFIPTLGCLHPNTRMQRRFHPNIPTARARPVSARHPARRGARAGKKVGRGPRASAGRARAVGMLGWNRHFILVLGCKHPSVGMNHPNLPCNHTLRAFQCLGGPLSVPMFLLAVGSFCSLSRTSAVFASFCSAMGAAAVFVGFCCIRELLLAVASSCCIPFRERVLYLLAHAVFRCSVFCPREPPRCSTLDALLRGLRRDFHCPDVLVFVHQS